MSNNAECRIYQMMIDSALNLIYKLRKPIKIITLNIFKHSTNYTRYLIIFVTLNHLKQTMKLILFLLFPIFVLMGCGGDDEKKDGPTIGSIFDGYKIGEGITPIGGTVDQTAPSKYIIIGTTEKGIWTGIFEQNSKSMLSQNVCNASLPTTSTVTIGNNKPETYHIDSFQVPVIKRIRNNILFTLGGFNKTVGTISAYLCKIENGVFYIKDYTNTDYAISTIYEWYDNTYFAITSAPTNKKYIIDDKFNELFEVYEDYYAFPRTYIDAQNIIYFNKGEIVRTYVKDNLWTSNAWTTHIIDANANVSNCKLSINSDALTFTCDYTLQNGNKGTLSRKLDINTGEIR